MSPVLEGYLKHLTALEAPFPRFDTKRFQAVSSREMLLNKPQCLELSRGRKKFDGRVAGPSCRDLDDAAQTRRCGMACGQCAYAWCRIAFYTLFSFAPVLIVAASVAGFIFG